MGPGLFAIPTNCVIARRDSYQGQSGKSASGPRKQDSGHLDASDPGAASDQTPRSEPEPIYVRFHLKLPKAYVEMSY